MRFWIINNFNLSMKSRLLPKQHNSGKVLADSSVMDRRFQMVINRKTAGTEDCNWLSMDFISIRNDDFTYLSIVVRWLKRY